MTQTTTNNKIWYLSSSGTGFSFPFRILSASDLVLYKVVSGTVSLLALNTDYTVPSTSVNNYNGGTVTLTTDLGGNSLLIEREVPLTQPVSLANEGSYQPTVVETALDRLTMIDQQEQEQISRCMIIPSNLQGISSLMPAPSASTLLGWDPSGTMLMNYTTSLSAYNSALANTGVGNGDYLLGVKRSVASYATTQHVANENREYNAVTDFQVPTDGVSNCTTAIQNAISLMPSGSTLVFPAGTFLHNSVLNKYVHIRGAGQQATIFKPYTAGTPAWQYVNYSGIGADHLLSVSHCSIWGTTLNTTYTLLNSTADIGFQFGHTSYQSGDENAGWAEFNHVTFAYLDKCVKRLYGNLGVIFNHCNFLYANYHTWSQSYSNMHAGCFYLYRCNLEYANVACHYLNSSFAGSGQVVFDCCIMENNPGFLFFVQNFANNGDSGIVIRDCWNEQNYTSSSQVNVMGTNYTPTWGYFANTPLVEVENTQLGPVTLISSNLRTRRCAIDKMTPGNAVAGAGGVSGANSCSIDSNSSMLVEDAQMFYGSANPVYTRSLLWTAAGYASASVVKHRTWSTKGGHNSTNVLKNPCTSSFSTTGYVITTTNVATDGVLFTPCQQMVAAGSGLATDPLGIVVTAGKYYVWGVTYKLISGTMPSISWPGGQPFTVNMPASSEWVTVMGICKATNTGTYNLNYNFSVAATIYLGGFFMLEFNTLQDAMVFADSGAFPA